MYNKQNIQNKIEKDKGYLKNNPIFSLMNFKPSLMLFKGVQKGIGVLTSLCLKCP